MLNVNAVKVRSPFSPPEHFSSDRISEARLMASVIPNPIPFPIPHLFSTELAWGNT
jgi:hypothetical protein